MTIRSALYEAACLLPFVRNPLNDTFRSVTSLLNHRGSEKESDP